MTLSTTFQLLFTTLTRKDTQTAIKNSLQTFIFIFALLSGTPMSDGSLKSLLGAQQATVGAAQKPCEPAQSRARRKLAQRSIRPSLQWSACVLLMEGFSTSWQIYISNCQVARLWLAQLKISDLNRRYARVKYN